MSEHRFSKDQISFFITRALETTGMPPDAARTVAGLMAEADLNGADGHGIFRLQNYIRRIQEGGINLHPKIHIEQEKSGMALVDGDNAQGHLVMKYCAERAIEKAKKMSESE